MKMSIEEVRNWLEHYIDYRGKIAFIETQIEWMQKELDEIKAAANMSEDEFKESLGMSKTQFSDMPPSVTNSFNSKTETAALNTEKVIEKEMAEISKELINKYAEIEWHKKGIDDLKRRVKTIDGWFRELKNKRMYFVIDLLYQQGEEMEEVKIQYYNKYDLRDIEEFKMLPQYESRRIYQQVCRVRDEALRHIVKTTEIKKLP